MHPPFEWEGSREGGEDRTKRGVEKGMEQEGDGVTGGEIKGKIQGLYLYNVVLEPRNLESLLEFHAIGYVCSVTVNCARVIA